MKEYEQRGSDDLQWQRVKEDVRRRDGGMCILCRLLTPGEYKQFLNSQPIYVNIIDPAHYRSVSSHLMEIYNMENIFSLCRPMHQRLDLMQSPLTGIPISRGEHEEWWRRIREGAKRLEEQMHMMRRGEELFQV